VPRGRLFGYFDLSNEMTMYVFVLVVVLAAFLLIYRIINSPSAKCEGDPRERAAHRLVGYNTDRYKLVVFVVVGDLGRARRLAQGAGVSARFAHRRALDHRSATCC